MIIRTYDPAKDADQVRELYTHRAPDRRLDPLNPLNFASIVVENDKGKIVGFMVARPFVNLHTVIDDNEGTPAEKFGMIEDMCRNILRRAANVGFHEAAYTCPAPYERLGERLMARHKGIYEDPCPDKYRIELRPFLEDKEV